MLEVANPDAYADRAQGITYELPSLMLALGPHGNLVRKNWSPAPAMNVFCPPLRCIWPGES